MSQKNLKQKEIKEFKYNFKALSFKLLSTTAPTSQMDFYWKNGCSVLSIYNIKIVSYFCLGDRYRITSFQFTEFTSIADSMVDHLAQ